MVWLVISHLFSTILELIHIRRLSNKDKDLEIMILRHQLNVMTRTLQMKIRITGATSLAHSVNYRIWVK